MTMTKTICTLSPFLLLGCLTVSPPDRDAKVTLIQSGAVIGTVSAIQNIYDREDERQKRVDLANKIKEMSLKIEGFLDQESVPLNLQSLSSLLKELPQEYQLYASSVLALLLSNLNAQVPTDLLSPDDKVYIRAFSSGLKQGADIVLLNESN